MVENLEFLDFVILRATLEASSVGSTYPIGMNYSALKTS